MDRKLVRELEKLAVYGNFDIIKGKGKFNEDIISVTPKQCPGHVFLVLMEDGWGLGGFSVLQHRSPWHTARYAGSSVSLNWVKGFLAANFDRFQEIIELRNAEQAEELARRDSPENLDRLREFCSEASDGVLDMLARGESVGSSPRRTVVTNSEKKVLDSEIVRRRHGLASSATTDLW